MTSAATHHYWEAIPPELRRRFAPLSVIDHDGVHAVFRALDLDTKQEVAIKALKQPDLAKAEQLRNEFAKLQAIEHNNILKAHRLFDIQEDWVAFTSEWIEGLSAFRWLWREEEDSRSVLASVDDETMEFNDPIRRPLSNRLGEFARDDGDGTLHRDRFEHIATQLFDALAWLRRNKLVHGDIKHANICIEHGGRLVLLDFGSAREEVQDGGIKALTPTYAAPEVLQGEHATYASDIYSAAVVLFELATRNRFAGGAMRSFHQRLRELRHSGVDGGMARALATALEPHPNQRPWATDATRWFARRRLRKLNPHDGVNLIGRKEIAESVLEAIRTNPNQVVVVSGPPGIGKSVFANHIATAWSEGYRAFCFWGACHPHRRTAFQALNVLVNSAKDALKARGDERRASTLWPTPALLHEVFPEVSASKETAAPSTIRDYAKSHLILERTFDEISEILQRIVQTRNVLMVIDDAQWVDADSLSAFRALLRRHPIGRIRLLLTTTDIHRLERFLVNIEEIADRPLLHVQLENYASEETAELSRSLSQNALSEREHALIHSLSQGNPLAATWLTRWALSDSNDLSSSPSMARIVSDMLRSLTPDARRIVHLLAVAQRPLPAPILSSLVRENIDAELQELENANVIHVPNHREPDVYSLRHRVFAASIQQSLSAKTYRTLLSQLAPVVSEQLEDDPEFIANLWIKAGSRTDAVEWMRIAARKAYEHHALRRAIKLYRELLTLEPEDHRTLRVELAECLALAGDLAAAGHEYLKLTETQLHDSAIDYRLYAAELFAATGNLHLAETLSQNALKRASCEPYTGPAATFVVHALQRRTFPNHLSLAAIQELATNPKAKDPAHIRKIEAHQLAVRIHGHANLMESIYHQTRAISLMLEGAPLPLARSIMTAELGFAGMAGPLTRPYVQRVERVASALLEASPSVNPIETLNFNYMIACKHLNFGELEEARQQYFAGAQLFYQKYLNAPWLGLSCTYFATFLLLRDLQIYDGRDVLQRGLRVLGSEKDPYFGIMLDICGRLEIALLENDLPTAQEILKRWPLPTRTPTLNIGESWIVVGHVNYSLYTGTIIAMARAMRANPIVPFTSLLSTYHFLAVEFGYAACRALMRALQSDILSNLDTIRFRTYLTAIRSAMRRLDSPLARCYCSAIDINDYAHNGKWREAAHAYSELTLYARTSSASAIALAARVKLNDTPAGVRLEETDYQTLTNLGIVEPRKFARIWV